MLCSRGLLNTKAQRHKEDARESSAMCPFRSPPSCLRAFVLNPFLLGQGRRPKDVAIRIMGELAQELDRAAGDDRAVAELVADRVDRGVEARERRVGEKLQL